MSNSDATRLLFDGIRLILQVCVERGVLQMPDETRREIQEWYDRCYRMLEGQEAAPERLEE